MAACVIICPSCGHKISVSVRTGSTTCGKCGERIHITNGQIDKYKK